MLLYCSAPDPSLAHVMQHFVPEKCQVVLKCLRVELGMRGYNLNFSVLEGKRLVLFIIQVKLSHAQEQLVGVDTV